MVGYLTAAAALFVAWKFRRTPYRKWAASVGHMALLQAVLGVIAVVTASPLGEEGQERWAVFDLPDDPPGTAAQWKQSHAPRRIVVGKDGDHVAITKKDAQNRDGTQRAP